MKAPFSLFLALRYLKPKRTFVSVITIIAILGVTLAISVLIIVIAVMQGFDQELRRKVLGFEPHLYVGNNQTIEGWRELQEALSKVPKVKATAPFVQGAVIAEHRGRIMTPLLRGVDAESELKIHDLAKFIKQGTMDLGSDKVIMGVQLAKELDVRVGDTITVTGPGNVRAIIDEVKRAADDPTKKGKTLGELQEEIVLPAELKVTGLFESGRFLYDSGVLFVALHVGQEMYGLGDTVHGISIMIGDPYEADQVRDELNASFTGEEFAQTWIDRNKDQFDAIRVERNVMFIILTFLIVIASFCIMNTLITVTVQKRREIGILKALGASAGQIVWVFFGQGVIVGVFGNIAGLGLGMLLVHFRNPFKEWLATTFGIQLLPPSIYQFSSLPAEVVPRDVAIICISAFVICSLAALLPAWFAARLDPVKALRYE